MQGRKSLGKQDNYKPLPLENKQAQKQKATCYMVIKFHDGNKWSKWSNEHAQPNKFLNINDSINEMFRIFNKYFTGKVHSGAIFDVRVEKTPGAHNKIYQFEKGYWKMEKQISW